MKVSTAYFIGCFVVFLMFLSNINWNHESSRTLFCFLDGVVFGSGLVLGVIMRNQGD